MTTTNYLELNSAYRDRNQWPLSSNFHIDISQSGTKGRTDAIDPVSNAAAKVVYTGSARNDSATATLPLSLIYYANYSAGTEIIIETGAGVSLRTEDDFYKGMILQKEDGTVERRMITKYRLLASFPGFGDDGYVTISEPFSEPGPNAWFTGGSVFNPTDTSYTIAPMLWIADPVIIANYYINSIVYNVSQDETRTITRYNATLAMAQLDSPAPTWNAYDTYIIRNELPSNSAVVGASTITTVTLDATASSVDGFYVGSFIRIGLIPAAIVAPYDSLPAPYNEVRRIVNYDGSTRVVTVFPAFTVAPSAPNNTYDIEFFTRDNAVPFDYTGSLLSLQEAQTYEVELVNVVFPNKILKSGYGGLPVFYPYFYIGLKSSSDAANSVSLYSNNPNAVSKLFRAVVDDTQDPEISPFIKLNGDGMTQTIKFNPRYGLQLSVCHNNGDYFETVGTEYFSPSDPNPLLQISAFFSIRRVIE